MRKLSIVTLVVLSSLAMSASAYAAATDYRFELAGAQKMAPGVNVVSVKLVHVPNGKPVSGAIIIGEKADMSPIGMAMMTAQVKALSAQGGVYRFEVQNGPVWNKPDNWALTLSAKVQGEPQTIEGSVVVKLTP